MLNPVSGNFNPAADPDVRMLRYVVEESLQTCRPRGMPDKPHVEPNRHHLRLPLSLAVQQIESVLQEREEVLRGKESPDSELQVVRAQGIRNDQVRLSLNLDPVGKLVIVRIRVVSKAALLDQQPTRMNAGTISAVPPQRSLAHSAGQRIDCLVDVPSFFILR